MLSNTEMYNPGKSPCSLLVSMCVCVRACVRARVHVCVCHLNISIGLPTVTQLHINLVAFWVKQLPISRPEGFRRLRHPYLKTLDT